MSKSVTVDVQFNSPIEKVWSALTDSATLSKWMLFKSNNFRPEEGHEFQFSGAEGYDQTIQCKVVEIDEPHKLAYTWSAPGVDGQQSETLVTFTLTAADGGTSLNLVQSGFVTTRSRSWVEQSTAGSTCSPSLRVCWRANRFRGSIRKIPAEASPSGFYVEECNAPAYSVSGSILSTPGKRFIFLSKE